MRFRDNVPGTLDSRGSQFDSTRDDGMSQDVGLATWFSRPIKIAEFTWDVNSAIHEVFNPWTLFWENARNVEKIKNYHLLRSTLHVKILINGNAFYYGRAIAAYEPLSPLDSSGPARSWVPEDRTRWSQRMHVYINPTTSQGGSLELPFFWPKNNWTIAQNDWRNMGEIVLHSFNDLSHANGGTEPLNISVMAWAENVKFAIPTRAVPAPSGTSIPEAGTPKDEHESNIISRPATNVARVAGALSNIPTIGPYAKATEIGARAVAQSAKLFGLSAPNELGYEIYEPHAKHSLAVTDTKQSANKTTLDSKQELTIDPRTTGIDPEDELPIASIAGRESYLTSFNWQQTDGSGDHLFNIRVDPGLKNRYSTEWHFPACAVAALPFQYWRGTMRFRFQIVASEYHKGRIRVVYDPRTGGVSSEYNTHYSTIHDIAECKDFTVDVGWGQDVPYKESLGWYTGPEFGATPLTTNIAQGNGVLSVYVLNKLSVPSTSVAPIEVNVFISMLDDFEVAAPDNKVSYLKFRPPVSVPPPRSTYTQFMDTLKSKSMPESGIPENTDLDDQDSPVQDPAPIDSIADAQMDKPQTTMVFMGEAVASFRTLLRRGNLAETLFIQEPLSTAGYVLSRASFPAFGGFVENQSPLPRSQLVSYADGRFYVQTLTTYMNYLSRAFLGWRGSTRWTIDTSTINVSSTNTGGDSDIWNSISFGLSRANSFTRSANLTELGSLLYTNIAPSLNELVRGTDLSGLHLGNTNVNPIQTIEVPYYQNDRFKYTFALEDYTKEEQGPGWKMTMMLPRSASTDDVSTVRMYVSAGEDFNFFFFNGFPPVYYEETFALDQSG